MITLFTTAKPFLGHSGIIQRNALQSWKLLHPDVEIILFGDEEGVAEVCAELGLCHEAEVVRDPSGPPFMNGMFARAQEIARHDILCYSNCDIILFSDFYEAVRLASASEKKFLMIGQRWDTDITEPVDFKNPEWATSLRQFARTEGIKQFPEFVDYFVFSKGLYDRVPPLVVGRCFCDWWLVWKGLSANASVIDCTPFVFAVHQNHGYGYLPQGIKLTETEPALRNIEVGGGKEHLRHIVDATYRLDKAGKIHYRPPYLRWWARHGNTAKHKLVFHTERVLIYKTWLPVWHFFLNVTRPLRMRLGLRSASKKNSSQAGTLP